MPNETFSDLWRDDFLQATSRVARRSLCQLNVEPYSRALFMRGLESRMEVDDGEENEVLDRAIEYAEAVGVEVVDMLTVVHEKVKALEPQVPAQHTFGGDGLQNFIRNHQDRLEHIKGQLGDLMTMVDHAIHHQDITLELYHWDLWQVERLNSKLLVQVAALEHGQSNPIRINSPEPIPVPPPGGLGPGSVLVEIEDGVDDEWNC